MLSWIMSRGIHDLGKILTGTIGTSICNHRGEWIGVLDDVTFHPINRQAEYAIIKSSVCFGRGVRVFAVPASSGYFELSRSGNLQLKAEKDDLQFAEGIPAADCPALSLKNGQHIYELYGYHTDHRPFVSHGEKQGSGAPYPSFLHDMLYYAYLLKTKYFSKYKFT